MTECNQTLFPFEAHFSRQVVAQFEGSYLGNNMAIYFAKDFLLLVIYISFIAAYRRKEVKGFPPFLIPLLLLVWFGVIQIFNPGSPHPMFGLLGFKVYFYYIPLFFYRLRAHQFRG